MAPEYFYTRELGECRAEADVMRWWFGYWTHAWTLSAAALAVGTRPERENWTLEWGWYLQEVSQEHRVNVYSVQPSLVMVQTIQSIHINMCPAAFDREQGKTFDFMDVDEIWSFLSPGKAGTLPCINERARALVLASHMHFACAFKWRCMEPHLPELKKTAFTIHMDSLSSWGVSRLKANAPEHMAPAWHFLCEWTLADSHQNVTVWTACMSNVWTSTHGGKLIYFASSDLFIQTQTDVTNA